MIEYLCELNNSSSSTSEIASKEEVDQSLQQHGYQEVRTLILLEATNQMFKYNMLHKMKNIIQKVFD